MDRIRRFFLSGVMVLTASLTGAGEPEESQKQNIERDLLCVSLARLNPMENSPLETFELETWCYLTLKEITGAVFVFNGDEDRVDAERAFLVWPDGSLSLAARNGEGTLSTLRLEASQFNPLSIPLEPPIGSQVVVEKQDLEWRKSVDEAVEFFKAHPGAEKSLAYAGETNLSATSRVIPWRGYWWPRKGQTLSGDSASPLAKYDSFVSAKTGQNPGAQEWENKNHRDQGVAWYGHCNGWAASSVLRKEPRKPVRDPRSGLVFRVSDQKGLLAETDFCARTAFFGKRYRGNEGDDIKDIYPAQFHQVLLFYIGALGKPVALDYDPTLPVDNHVITGYEMRLREKGEGELEVKTVLTIHKYDDVPTDKPGPAPSYRRTYRYTLQVGNDGQFSGGNWLTGNPDFLWVPLGLKDCRSNNVKLSRAIIDEILSLPAQ